MTNYIIQFMNDNDLKPHEVFQIEKYLKLRVLNIVTASIS